jgi:hypothetical protein
LQIELSEDDAKDEKKEEEEKEEAVDVRKRN